MFLCHSDRWPLLVTGRIEHIRPFQTTCDRLVLQEASDWSPKDIHKFSAWLNSHRSQIIQLMKPIYENLSSDSLLERFMRAHTRNSNEYLKNCIWILAPKVLYLGKRVVKIATHLVLMSFKERLLFYHGRIGDYFGRRNRIHCYEHRTSDPTKKAPIQQRQDWIISFGTYVLYHTSSLNGFSRKLAFFNI